MPFCPQCGTAHAPEAKFCANCGNPLTAPGATPAPQPKPKPADEPERTLWTGRATNKGVPLAVHYELTTRRLIYRGGIIGKKEDEILLYRIRDIRLKQGLSDRALGLGNIEVYSTDPTTPALVIQGIKDAASVRNMLRDAVEKDRARVGVGAMERY